MAKLGPKYRPKSKPRAFDRIMENPEFKKLLDYRLAHVKINRSFDIPYVAGYSEDGSTVFIDRNYNSDFDSVDVTKFLVLHELVEKTILDLYHTKYLSAHYIATHAERLAVKKSGLLWSHYCGFNDYQIKEIGHEKIRRVPRDLDIEPYIDDKDFAKIRELKHAMREEYESIFFA